MDVGARAERVKKRGVLRYMGEHAKLDLRIVRGNQDPVGGSGDEGAADAAAERRANRDVL